MTNHMHDWANKSYARNSYRATWLFAALWAVVAVVVPALVWIFIRYPSAQAS